VRISARRHGHAAAYETAVVRLKISTHGWRILRIFATDGRVMETALFVDVAIRQDSVLTPARMRKQQRPHQCGQAWRRQRSAIGDQRSAISKEPGELAPGQQPKRKAGAGPEIKAKETRATHLPCRAWTHHFAAMQTRPHASGRTGSAQNAIRLNHAKSHATGHRDAGDLPQGVPHHAFHTLQPKMKCCDVQPSLRAIPKAQATRTA
jgi:hypothetical protein